MLRLPGGLWLVLVWALLLNAAPANASAESRPSVAGSRPTVVLAFLPAKSDAAVESELASVPALSTGLMSATQGTYITGQLLLDITQGARVSYSAYTPPLPPQLVLTPLAGSSAKQPTRASEGASAGAAVTHWPQVLRRAARAPQLLEPGLLAGQIPGGSAYVGVVGQDDEDGVVAADRTGHVAAVSLGSAATLLERIAALRERYGLVVADLPSGQAGYAQLRLLSARRPRGELLLVVEHAPDKPGHELLWAAVGGLGGGRTLTSTTTEERGLIAAIDLAPTILRHLDLPVPASVRGLPVRTDGAFDGAYLRALKARLGVVYPRRLPALVLSAPRVGGPAVALIAAVWRRLADPARAARST